jgi:Ca2+-binding RTX toxin-like protein
MKGLGVCLLALYCAPGAAYGAEVEKTEYGDIAFTAAPGEANDIRITTARSGEDVLVTDRGAPVTAVGPDCVSTGPHSARCSYDPECQTLQCSGFHEVVLGDRRDTIHLVGTPSTSSGVQVRGGPGPDRMASKWFWLSALGGSGDDVLIGGARGDFFDGGGGADLVNGRGGRHDTASYGSRSAGVVVTLDDRADDGERGEGDRVIVEDVVGGQGADTLVGDADENYLSGEGGDDTIIGGRGRDLLVGRAGSDRLDGGRGDDGMLGDEGDDWLRGRAGADSLRGYEGADDLRCGPGGDYAESSDFGFMPKPDGVRDLIRCGSGQDTVVAGAEDSVGRECEDVTRDPASARSALATGRPGA